MKSKRGGKREGAGRKPIKDKKIPFVMWYPKSFIKKWGGAKKLRGLVDRLLINIDE